MKRAFAAFLAMIGLTASLAHANLLLNGDFNNPNSVAAPTDWSTWSYGGGWANHQDHTGAGPLDGIDGSYYMAAGGAGSAGGGVYQIVAGTAGLTYTLSVDAGAEAWYRPQGEMRLFFLDAGDNVLASTNPVVVDTGPGYDTGKPWANYSLSMVAPTSTTQVKVEFAMNGNDGGTVWFDNANLTAVPEPGTLGLVAGGLVLLGYGFRRRARRS